MTDPKMLLFRASADVCRIVVLNPKGGSGKTTLAFNLAGYLASTHRRVAIIDMDRQGSSMRWLQNRSAELPEITGISAKDIVEEGAGIHRIDVPENIDYVVIDAPAGLRPDQLIDYTCGAHAIFVPVLPSDLDIHAASRLISDLLLKAQVSRRNGRVGVVANRVKERTIAYQHLARFLSRLSIAVVGHIRDSQNYVLAARRGLCIHELTPSRAGKDLAQWDAITQWLEKRLATPLSPRDLLRPDNVMPPQRRNRLRPAMLMRAAAIVTFIAAIGWLWPAMQIEDEMPPVVESISPGSGSRAPGEILTANRPSDPPSSASPTPGETFVVEETAELPHSAGERLRDKWRLSGVAHQEGASVLILRDRVADTFRRISNSAELDGWAVKDSGPDYAVFSRDGEEVRLVLNEDFDR